mmetsp:Transcript_2667/g.11394  ORF Transcript_2667/g.11394 Transcript_2667/m.11394 type:complete len:235 (+) Transcript_2667:697-1401(+)
MSRSRVPHAAKAAKTGFWSGTCTEFIAGSLCDRTRPSGATIPRGCARGSFALFASTESSSSSARGASTPPSPESPPLRTAPPFIPRPVVPSPCPAAAVESSSPIVASSEPYPSPSSCPVPRGFGLGSKPARRRRSIRRRSPPNRFERLGRRHAVGAESTSLHPSALSCATTSIDASGDQASRLGASGCGDDASCATRTRPPPSNGSHVRTLAWSATAMRSTPRARCHRTCLRHA